MPARRVHPAHLPRCRDRSAVFAANLLSPFYRLNAQAKLPEERIRTAAAGWSELRGAAYDADERERVARPGAHVEDRQLPLR